MTILNLSRIFSVILVICLSTYGSLTYVSETAAEIHLRFSLPSYSLKTKTVNGIGYTHIHLPNILKTNKKGYPALPYFTQGFMIQPSLNLRVEITDIQYKNTSVKPMLPARGPLSRNRDPRLVPYTFAKIYTKDVLYPSSPVSLGKPYNIRNLQGVNVTIHPFQYNPRKKRLQIIESMTIIIKKSGQSLIPNHVYDNKLTVSPRFINIYKKFFLNYSSSTHNLGTSRGIAEETVKMLIVTASSFKDAVLPLAEWKNKKGISTTIYEYPTETGGSGHEALKTFISQKYTNEGITYVLLVGDLEYIPSKQQTGLWDGQTGYMDPDYILLEGEDFYPDAFIGRLSVSTLAETEILVNKILQYEQEPVSTDLWYAKATGIASDEGSPKDSDWMEGFRNTFLINNYSEVDQIYAPDATADDVSTAINTGRSWVNYMGHGSITSWGTSGFSSLDVSTLVNAHKLPVIISVACLNGRFSSNCFAEAWTRQENGGAIAFLGSTINQPWVPPQYGQQGILDYLLDNVYFSLGEIVYHGEIKMLIGTSSTSISNQTNSTFLTWTLFGDPSLLVYTQPPSAITITHQPTISRENQNLEVTASEDSVLICLYSKNKEIHTTGLSSRGNVLFSIELGTCDTIFVTATKKNRVAYQGSIAVTGSPIVKDSFAPTNNLHAVQWRQIKSGFAVKASTPGFYTITTWNCQGKKISTFVLPHAHSWYSFTSESADGIYFVTVDKKDYPGARRIFFMNSLF